MDKTIVNRCRRIALAIAPTGNLRTHHVAFLIYKGRIRRIGWNKAKTHPITKEHPYHDGKVFLHAEADVIIKAGLSDLEGWTLISLRVMGNLVDFGPSKPCSGCSSLIKQVGITEVIYD